MTNVEAAGAIVLVGFCIGWPIGVAGMAMANDTGPWCVRLMYASLAVFASSLIAAATLAFAG